MKTLVTGATGFIGYHLVKALVEKGNDVRCLVRKTSKKISEIEKLGVECIYGDLLDKHSVERAVKGMNIIYHLGGEVYSFKVKDYYQTNVQGTKNLLDACLSNSIKRFIYLSSIAVVGPNNYKHKLLTEDDPCKPITPYGMSKLKSEKIVLEYFRRYNIPIVIVRPPTVYGPGQSKVLSDFFKRVNTGKFYVFGGGEYLRSLCYIKNLIDGVILVETKNEAIGEIFFISDKKIYTFKEIVQTIAEVQNKQVSLYDVPPFIANVFMFVFISLSKLFKINILKFYTIGTMSMNLACEISKAEKILLYEPKITFKEGIKTTNDFLKSTGM